MKMKMNDCDTYFMFNTFTAAGRIVVFFRQILVD